MLQSGARPVRRKFEDILNEPEVKHEVSRAPLPKNDYYKGLAVPLRKSDKYVKPEKTDYRTTRERGEFAVSARLNALVTPRVVTEKFAEKKERVSHGCVLPSLSALCALLSSPPALSLVLLPAPAGRD